jgi:predicted phage terminase large subunit-like protein
MTLDFLREFPHLASPAMLAHADTGGKFTLPAHLAKLNEALIEAWNTPNGRLASNFPFQHGKSLLCSVYFPAWVLLLNPTTRIVLASYGEQFSGSFGMKVREVIERWGRPLGVSLRPDARSKNEWVIAEHGGGMVCKGRHGAVVGRAADLLLLDDLLENAEEALSRTVLDGMWDWYVTAAYSRLGPTAPIVSVGTRWCRGDWFGRVQEESRRTREPWRWLVFKAIATENDILGRKPGAALWPERVPLSRLEMIRAERPQWFSTCWQQEPLEDSGLYFRPRDSHGNLVWPVFHDNGDHYLLTPSTGATTRRPIAKSSVVVFAVADWATSERQSADFTCIGVFGLTPDGALLTIDIVNRRVRIEECVPLLADVCRQHHPSVVAVESGAFQTALAVECRRHPSIPEPWRLSPEGKGKLQRALPAINTAQGNMLHLPAHRPHWLDEYLAQLSSFTGTPSDDHDDMVDVTAYAAMVAQRLRGPVWRHSDDSGPSILTPGRGFDDRGSKIVEW